MDIQALINERIMNKYAKPTNNNQGGFGGLLNFVQSPRGMDMATGLLAQSGYSPTPTNLGSAFGKANQYASGMEIKRNANDLAELQALGTIYKNTKAPKKSDFFQQLDMFNQISSIPADQRSADQINSLEILNDKLKKDPSINEFKVYLANKYQSGEELTKQDKDLLGFLKTIDPIAQLLSERIESKVGGSDTKKDNKKTFDAQSEISKMENDMTTEQAKEYFNNLPQDQQDAIRKILNG